MSAKFIKQSEFCFLVFAKSAKKSDFRFLNYPLGFTMSLRHLSAAIEIFVNLRRCLFLQTLHSEHEL